MNNLCQEFRSSEVQEFRHYSFILEFRRYAFLLLKRSGSSPFGPLCSPHWRWAIDFLQKE